MDADKRSELQRKRAKLIKKPRYGTVPEVVYVPGEEGLLEMDFQKVAETQAEQQKVQEDKDREHRRMLAMMDDISMKG